jgi:hypothetical protein
MHDTRLPLLTLVTALVLALAEKRVALLRPVKALTELDCEVATLLEAAAPRAAAGAMATAAAMQDAISTELTGAETIDEFGMGNGED